MTYLSLMSMENMDVFECHLLWISINIRFFMYLLLSNLDFLVIKLLRVSVTIELHYYLHTVCYNLLFYKPKWREYYFTFRHKYNVNEKKNSFKKKEFGHLKEMQRVPLNKDDY